MKALRQSLLQDFFRKSAKTEVITLDDDTDEDVPVKPKPSLKRDPATTRASRRDPRTLSILSYGSALGFEEDDDGFADTLVELVTCGDAVLQKALQTSANAPPAPVKRTLLAMDSWFTPVAKRRPKPVVRSGSPPLAALPALAMTLLTPEQHQVMQAVLSGVLVFYTGSAGTGKSVVLRHLVSLLRSKFGEGLGVCALTGMAACNIGGMTLHKLFGIGTGLGLVGDLANRIQKNRFSRLTWQKLRVVIIDEISMIDGDLFDKLEAVARVVRGNNRPFGGIQVVCLGDFFQLPPVLKDKRAKFCFQAETWPQVIKQKIVLRKIWRQRDLELIEMLNTVRMGRVDATTTRKFTLLARRVVYDDGIGPTELFPTRQEVHRANQARLAQLPGDVEEYIAQDYVPHPLLAGQLEHFMAEKVLRLKPDAQVMCIKNISDEIVNGLVGTVVVFLTSPLWHKVLEYWSEDDIMSHQRELRLVLKRIGDKHRFSPQDTEYYHLLSGETKRIVDVLLSLAVVDLNERMPVVAFRTPRGSSLHLIEPLEFTVDSTSNTNKVVRTQYPLILAWAMSIHKSQGQSIERLRIDLHKIFEMGQIYVALSRATNKDTLEVLNFDARKVKVSPEVIDFYKSLTA